MFRSLLSVLVLGAVALGQDDSPPAFPKPGSDIPGPFHVYNVTGKKKGNYHCLVSEFGLNPVVMVVVRGVEDKEGLQPLLGKLDNLIDKNPNTRLASFAVFLSSTLKDVAREDDQRDRLSKKIEDLFKAGGVKHIVLALDTPKKLAKWPLDEKADVVVVLYNEYRTLAVHNLTWEQLNSPKKDELSAKAKEVLDDVRRKFGANRG
ncbi:MAG: hypothetical protein HYS12_16890 [Planctomycetes bacterium]|nr:hypothetical protein [Planctomycetota bacterium]